MQTRKLQNKEPYNPRNKIHPMKTILVLLSLLINIASLAQEELYRLPLKFDGDNKVYFEEISEVKGFTSAQIHSSIRAGIAEVYKSSKTVIDLDDKEGGQIFVKGFIVYNATDGIVSVNCNLYHTVKIYIKDEKVRIVFDNLRLEFSNGDAIPIERYITDENLYKPNGKPKKMMQSHKEGVISSWRKINSSLVNSIKKNDW